MIDQAPDPEIPGQLIRPSSHHKLCNSIEQGLLYYFIFTDEKVQFRY